MLAIGGLLVSIAVLALVAVAPVFRRDNPPRWTTRGWIGELVTLAIVCTLALGLGYLGAGGIETFTAGPDYLDLGLLGVVLVISVVAWRRLRARTRAGGGEADARVQALAPGSGQAYSGSLAATAEPASAPPSPHKAA